MCPIATFFEVTKLKEYVSNRLGGNPGAIYKESIAYPNEKEKT